MLSSAERTSQPPKPLVLYDDQLYHYGNFRNYPTDIITATQFPPRAEHSKLGQSVKPAALMSCSPQRQDDRMKRIFQEVR